MRKAIGEPSSRRWEAWKARAAKETTAAIIAFNENRKYEVRKQVYSACSDDIRKHFFNKCAYCEGLVYDSQISNPDVEHYFPKGNVRERNGEHVVDCRRRPHPGYFWLAYHWKNLLPACAACNRPAHGDRPSLIGKWDFFPISGRRTFRPGTLSIEALHLREKPLLLNPYFDDPADHLSFDPETAIIGYKTSRGEATIAILGLNRDGLITQRAGAVIEAKYAFEQYMTAFLNNAPNADSKFERLKAEHSPTSCFSAFRQAAIEPKIRALAQLPNLLNFREQAHPTGKKPELRKRVVITE